MTMTPKTVVVLLDDSEAGRRRARVAARCASLWEAHLVGVLAVFADVTWPRSAGYARGDAAIRQVVEHKLRRDLNANINARRLGMDFRAICREFQVSNEYHPLGRERTAKAIIAIALHSDLVIAAPRADHNGLPDELSLDTLLLRCGAPCLIVPTEWQDDIVGERIVVGWNGSRQARRAVSDALPFIVSSRSVTVVSVGSDLPDPRAEHGPVSMTQIVTHLRRYGAQVEYRRLPGKEISVRAALLSYAESHAADLLVAGAYSHTRFRGILLGGITRTLLARTTVPTLFSR